MTEAMEPQHANDAGLFDNQKLKTLVSEISEVMFDWGETSPMQRKIDARLLEQVSRALHRCEDRPERIRQVEEDLWHLDEPELGIALLRHFFLVRSEATEQSVIRQLVRLAQSQDRKTSELTRDALRDAAYSEVPRLQNIGCHALFQSNLLREAELREFARSEEIRFEHRLEAVHHLVRQQSGLAAPAFVDVVTVWGSLRRDDQRKFEKRLRDLAYSFDSYETRDRDFVDRLIDQLFAAADTKGLAKPQKKFLQSAMAALPQRTTEYIQTLGTEHLGSTSVIFTLGTCSRRSPIATRALLEHAQQVRNATIPNRSQSLKWCAYQLKRAKHWDDPDIHSMLDELIESVHYDQSLLELNEVAAALEEARESWQEGAWEKDLDSLLRALATKFEGYRELEEDDAWELRYEFERGRKPPSATMFSGTEREVLIQAMDETAKVSPWNSSASWLADQYVHFEGDQRTVIQDALGSVALREKSVVETPLYQRLVEFFQHWLQHGSVAEQQRASEWLDRLTGDRIPAPPSS